MCWVAEYPEYPQSTQSTPFVGCTAGKAIEDFSQFIEEAEVRCNLQYPHSTPTVPHSTPTVPEAEVRCNPLSRHWARPAEPVRAVLYPRAALAGGTPSVWYSEYSRRCCCASTRSSP